MVYTAGGGGTIVAGVSNIEGVRPHLLDENRDVTYATGTTVPTNGSSGFAKGCLFVDTDVATGTSGLYQNIGTNTSSNFSVIDTSGGSSPSGGLDDAYSIDRTVNVDQGAVTWTDSTTGADNSFALVKDGAGSGNVLDISIDAALTGDAVAIDMNLGIAARAIFIDNGGTARTGADILVTDDSTGNHSVIDINSSGAGASVGFDWTGSYAGSPGGNAIALTYDNSDNLDTGGVVITRGTGVRTASAIAIVENSTGSANIVDVNVAGVYTGNVFDVTTSAAATGNVYYADLDSAVAATALHIEGSGVRTQPFVEVISDCTGAANFITCAANGAFTGDVLSIDLDAAVGANAISLDAGAGVRTAPVMLVTMDGSGASAGATFMDLNVTATGATASGVFDIDVSGVYTGAVFDVALSAAATGQVLNVDMDAAVGSQYLVLDAGGGTRTVAMNTVTFDGDGTTVGGTLWDINVTNTGAASNPLYDIDVTGVYTGNIFDVTFSSAAATGDALSIAMGTNVAGSAIAITAAGGRTDDLIKITDSSTSNSPMFDINITGINTGNCIDIEYSSAAATGTALNIVTGTNLAGNAIQITTAGARTAPVINVVGAGTDGGTDDHIFFVTQSGILDSNIVQLTYDTAASTGDAINIDMGTNLAGQALAITTAGARTGPVILVTGAGTDGGADDHIIDINQTGALDSNVLDITYSSGVSTGNAIDVNMGTNVAGMAVSVSSAATGVANEGSCFDVSHTGALVANADVVRLNSTGNISSTSNVLSVNQSSGAGTAGANAVHINATGTNVEALEVEAGLVFRATQSDTLTGNGETTTATANVVFVDPGGASRTGHIVAAGLRDGQHIKIVNIADAAETITMAASGTSNVAPGTSLVIGQFEGVELVWNATRALRYPLITVFS